MTNKVIDRSKPVSLVVESYQPSTDNGVLAKLRGKFSTTVESSRNGFEYTSDLWEHVIESETTQEMLVNKTFYGELSHPPRNAEFLSEVQMNNVSHNITKLEYNKDTGLLYGELDILDTPSGRIAHTLLKYGSKLGISSRGITFDENSSVMTPSNYYLVTWDLVALNGVPGCRLDVVSMTGNPTEGYKELDNVVTEAIKAKDLSSLKTLRSVVESVQFSNDNHKDELLDDIDKVIESDGSSDTSGTQVSDVEGPVHGINVITTDDQLKMINDFVAQLESASIIDGIYQVDPVTLIRALNLYTSTTDNQLLVQGTNVKDVLNDDEDTEEVLNDQDDQEIDELVTKITTGVVNNLVSTYESKIAKLTKQVESLVTRNSTLSNNLKSMRDKITQISLSANENISKKDSVIKELTRLNESYKAKLAKSTNESLSTRSVVESLRKELDSKSSEISRLTNELDIATERVMTHRKTKSLQALKESLSKGDKRITKVTENSSLRSNMPTDDTDGSSELVSILRGKVRSINK